MAEANMDELLASGVSNDITDIAATISAPTNPDQDQQNLMNSINSETTTLTIATKSPLQNATTDVVNATIDPADNINSTTVGPITKRSKLRPAPYTKPILLSGDRKSKKRKSITWKPDEKIQKVHFFEYIADERINVTRLNNLDQQPSNDAQAPPANPTGGGSSLVDNANKLPNVVGGKITSTSVDSSRRPHMINGKSTPDNKCIELIPWRPMIPIDFTPLLPSPGWNSLERSAQAERETYVLGAIDLPGHPATLDEPGNDQATGSNSTEPGNKDEASSVKIIPLENPDGMFTEYPDMYNSEIVNGVSDNNPQLLGQNMTLFCNQQSQLLPNQFHQQLANANAQNPFAFHEMSAQFQQQQQFPFQQQSQFQQSPFLAGQQPQQQLLGPMAPAQQQPFVDQQAGLNGPIMPWLNYPFNQVNENSHAHLFRRPAT